ncbi:MAG: hypothetical protein ACI4V1_10785, partial [Eubacteriales bacterium]
YFELAELALFKVVSDEPEMQYDLGEVVEEGVLPELVPVVEAEEAAAMEEEPVEESADEAPAFGIFTNFPLPMYKFLPRG